MTPTADALELTLPYPPSVNRYWRAVAGRVLISAEGRRYRTDVLAAVFGRGLVAPPGELSVEVDLHPPDRRRRDLDNTCKALLDALTAAGVYSDDSLIGDLHVRRLDVVAGGRVVVRIGARQPV